MRPKIWRPSGTRPRRAQPWPRRRRGHALAERRSRPPGGRTTPAIALRRGRLAGAVGADQRDTSPSSTHEIDPLDRRDGAVRDLEPVELEGAARPSNRRCGPAAVVARRRARGRPRSPRSSSRIVFGRALGDLAAVVEHRDAVRDAHHHAHVVLDQETVDAARRGSRISSQSTGRLGRVHARGRLVEQQQLRLGGQRAGDLEPALRRRRAGARQVVGSAARPTRSSSSSARARASRSSRRDVGVRKMAPSEVACVRACRRP